MENLIGLDWGTSSLRGYFLNENSVIIEKIESERGVASISNNSFTEVLTCLLDSLEKKHMIVQ